MDKRTDDRDVHLIISGIAANQIKRAIRPHHIAGEWWYLYKYTAYEIWFRPYIF